MQGTTNYTTGKTKYNPCLLEGHQLTQMII